MKKRVGILILMLLLVGLGTTAISVAAKKAASSKGVTVKQGSALAAGTTALGSATCAKKSHATGGGFSVLNGYSPAVPATASDPAIPASGTNSLPQNLYPSGSRTWKTSISSFAATAPTNTTTYVRCEKNKYSSNAGTISGSFNIAMDQASTIKLVCPSSTRVISGGYSVSPSFDASAPVGTTAGGLLIIQNHRTRTSEWRVTAVNFTNPAATVKGYAVCEHKKGYAITEHSKLVAFSQNTRAAATAKCSSNQHVVSGGFLLSPELQPGESGAPPVGVVDTSMPVSSNAWQNKLFSYGPATAPGSALTTYVYCRSNNVKY